MVIVDEDANKDQNEDDNKENLFADAEKEDETDALINKMMAAENKDDKKRKFIRKRKENIDDDEYEYEEELEEKVNFDSEYGNDIWEDFDEDGQDEPDQQTGKEGAETEEEENELLIKMSIKKRCKVVAEIAERSGVLHVGGSGSRRIYYYINQNVIQLIILYLIFNFHNKIN
ncbi:MAG: hypothetical protein EZS28_027450 [Streblomastix strix]|uniref:Uncharacterized protein n=1 Tax=Streblomastix strix TaxID=222440 RepID=A0A5J4V3G1_9EUKA|nr:MAG: hypothetical protein EZS28_027450 [Streblomastix strix]